MDRLEHCEQMLILICDKLGIESNYEKSRVKIFYEKEQSRIRDAINEYTSRLADIFQRRTVDLIQVTVHQEMLGIQPGCYELAPTEDGREAWAIYEYASLNEKRIRYEFLCNERSRLEKAVREMLSEISLGHFRINTLDDFDWKKIMPLKTRIRLALTQWRPDQTLKLELETKAEYLTFSNGDVLLVHSPGEDYESIDMVQITVLPRKKEEDDSIVAFHSRAAQVEVKLDQDLIADIERWMITQQVKFRDQLFLEEL